MRLNQSCGACAHCHRRDNLNIEQGECRRELRSQMIMVPGPVVGTVGPRTFSYYPEVKLKDRGCSHFTLALEVADA